jgi:hypothetical protein
MRWALWLASLALCFGCSQPQAPAQTAAAVQHEPVAAGFCMSRKKIFYSELVYKVLYNETVTAESVFEGLWDVDSELSVLWASQLSALGIRSRSLTELLPSPDLESFCRELPNAALQPLTVLPEPVRQALLQQHIGYLLLLHSNGVSVSAYSLGPSQVNLASELVLQNVRTNAIEYREPAPFGETVSLGESTRSIEAQNLARLKAITREIVTARGPALIRSVLRLH